MRYFIYKLWWGNGGSGHGGYQPKKDVSETWLDIGYFGKPDGRMLGYCTKPLSEAFLASDVEKFSIVEITAQEALAFASEYNSPQLDAQGKIFDANRVRPL